MIKRAQKKKKSITLFVVSIENSKTLKFHIFSRKASVVSVICSISKNEDENT